MSENVDTQSGTSEMNDDSNDQTNDLRPPVRASVTMSVRSIVATVVAAVLTIGFGAGLALSKRDKSDSVKHPKVHAADAGGSEVTATVNGVAITRVQFDALVKSLHAPKNIAADVVRRSVATQAIERLLIQQAIDERKLRVTPADTAAAKTAIQNDQTLQTADPTYRGLVIVTQANVAALIRSIRTVPSEAAIRAAYSKQNACVSNKGLAGMQFTTRAEAVAALNSIRGGEDFVKIARTKSLAKGSATAGNSNCLDEATLPAELVKPIKNAQPGVVTEPVKYSTGYALLKLSTPFVPPPLSEVRAQIIAALQQQDQSVSIFAKKLYGEAVVKVDPTIGTWKPDPQNQGQFGVVAIPGNAPKGTPISRPTQLSVQNERHSAPKVKP